MGQGSQTLRQAADQEFFLPGRQLSLFDEQPQAEDSALANRSEPGTALIARSSPRHVDGAMKQREYRLRPDGEKWALEHRDVGLQGRQRAVYPWKPWKIGDTYHDVIRQGQEDSQFRGAQSLHDVHAHHVQHLRSTQGMQAKLLRAKLEKSQTQQHLDDLSRQFAPQVGSGADRERRLSWLLTANSALGREYKRLHNKLRDHDVSIGSYTDYLHRADQSHPFKIKHLDLEQLKGDVP